VGTITFSAPSTARGCAEAGSRPSKSSIGSLGVVPRGYRASPEASAKSMLFVTSFHRERAGLAQAVTMRRIGPWAWFVDNVVLPTFVLFALVTFVVEACIGRFC
jgi:hypothetical protein